ncbi:molybdopterin-dependent oxidoreductase [Thiosulfativibrio zosterae]|uniref:Polysulfide reductase n=1 Tax=Thiosulfativibrio zosterae TaxID=2675053 RepID=A0A6F8PMV6_9GAMM|nr:molybdopterin-dependent oxidoreductase [Thiosulfativibrio zosterae]BBP43330.1 polysulfide reductase [Thiosulfativibrio zosterae]
MAWKFPKLTRRTFLQGAAAATAVGTLATSKIASAHLPSWDDLMFADSKRKEMKEKINFTICNFCSSLCDIEIRTLTDGENSRIVKLEGNPHSTLNRGRACARGQSGVFQTYDTDRIKTPLIRVEGSKRGEMAFRKASWEEAYAYISKNSEGVKPWEWTTVGGWTNCIFYMNWAVAFSMANQIPNIVASPMQHCVTTGHLGTDAVTGNFNIHDEILPDFDNARYIMYIANNGSMGAVSTARVVRATEGIQRGAKVVVLDPRLSETAAKADEWVRIRPGTDLDFTMAMMNEIMSKDYYDKEFCIKHTNLPFFITKDADGEWQIVRDAKGNFAIWDEVTEQAQWVKSHDNENTRDINGKRVIPVLRLPEGFTFNGKAVQTVFEAQLDEIKHVTPEFAAKTTTIPAEDIVRIAYEYSHIKPSIIDPGWMGARYNNVQMLRRTQAMLQTLVGGIDVKGGWINAGEVREKVEKAHHARMKGETQPYPLATVAGMPFAEMVVDVFSNPKNFNHGKPAWAYAFAEQQKAAGKPWVSLPVMADTGLEESVKGELIYKGEQYLTKALFINGANPVHHYFPEGMWKDILQHDNMKCVVCMDVLPSDTTAYADVILPNSTYLERDEPAVYGGGVNQDLNLRTRFRAIDPLYDTKEVTDVMFKMTEIISGAAGVEAYFNTIESLAGISAKTAKQYIAEEVAKGTPDPYAQGFRRLGFELAASNVGETPEALEKILREKGVYYIKTMDELLKEAAMPQKMPVPTRSGRLEFYSGLFENIRGKSTTRAPNFGVLATHFPSGIFGPKTFHDKMLGEQEFYFTYGKSPTVSHGSTNANNPVLHAINVFKEDIYTGIWINPARAEKMGIKTGDQIKLTNNEDANLNVQGKAYVTKQVQPEAVFMYSSFGTENKALSRASGFGSAINKIIGYKIDPVVAGFRSQEFTITVEKV